MYVYGDNRAYSEEDNEGNYGSFYNYGVEGDGDDIIDVGENYGVTLKIYGQGGNDKIIGSLQGEDGGSEYLSGGAGDDKIWAHNPGQYDSESADLYNYMYGDEGNDILYGSNRRDYIHGDNYDITEYGSYGDGRTYDDIIYSGASDTEGVYDYIYGGKGDDKIYGEGKGGIYAYGEWGDDLIHGTEGNDDIYGDDDDTDYFGDDTLYGHGGEDEIEGGAGDDLMFGGDDDDELEGHEGDDTIYGDAGDDYINTGTGWDTVFGGEGCDYIYSYDGGDVIWGGECLYNDDTANDYQYFYIYGTGPDPENFTVIMDFWREDAFAQNFICLYPDNR